MKHSYPYDLIVIGGGSAGHAAARNACVLGLRTALVEHAEVLGGLCVLAGCMPSKILIETANRMRAIRDAHRFGIRVEAPALDEDALRKRLRELVGNFQKYRVEEMQDGSYELVRGSASFMNPHQIEVSCPDASPRRMEAAAFIIATGSCPAIPDVPGLAGTPYWTSRDVVRLPPVPQRLAVVGAGAIGMECAHLFEGLGTSELTVVTRDSSVLGRIDPDVSAGLEEASRSRGIRFFKNTELSAVRHENNVFHLTLKGEAASLEADALLMATGRKPNTDRMRLEEIGVALENGSIIIDERCATSVGHIFAAGDCASPVPVVHLAVRQGEVAACNVARLVREGRMMSTTEWHRDTAMSGWFTEPQSVQIGHTEDVLRENGLHVISSRVDYTDHGKGMIKGVTHGFVKLLADAETGRLLGAAALGPAVIETCHSVSTAIHAGLTVREYLALPHYHPTLAEAWSRAADALADKIPTDR